MHATMKMDRIWSSIIDPEIGVEEEGRYLICMFRKNKLAARSQNDHLQLSDSKATNEHIFPSQLGIARRRNGNSSIVPNNKNRLFLFYAIVRMWPSKWLQLSCNHLFPIKKTISIRMMTCRMKRKKQKQCHFQWKVTLVSINPHSNKSKPPRIRLIKFHWNNFLKIRTEPFLNCWNKQTINLRKTTQFGEILAVTSGFQHSRTG